jgi:hypothetical protein
MARIQLCQLKLALYVGEGNLEIPQRHLGRLMAEKLHKDRQAHSGSEHLSSEGVTKLVRDDARPDADRGSDLMQCNSQIGAEPRASTKAGEEKAVNGRSILGTQQLETMDNPTDEGIYGNETLCPQLTKGHMNGPLILADTAQTIERQIEALADAHTGVPEEQQGVADPIVTPQQLLLDQLILLGREGSRQTTIWTRDVVGADQTGQERYPLGPRQLFKDAAQTDDIVGVSQFGESRLARAQ